MNKRGMMFEELIGIVLAVAGGILLGAIVMNFYNMVFPGDRLAPETINSVDEILTHLDRWNRGPDFASTHVPFEIQDKTALVFFGKEVAEVIEVNFRQSVKRPSLRQCKQDACMCVYKIKLASKPILVECWELKEIDEVYTYTLHTDEEVGASGDKVLTSIGQLINKKSLSIQALINRQLMFQQKLFASRLGGVPFSYVQTYRKNLAGGSLGDLSFSPPILSTYTTAGDEPALHMLYLEKARTPSGKNILFITPSFDPTIPQREQAWKALFEQQAA